MDDIGMMSMAQQEDLEDVFGFFKARDTLVNGPRVILADEPTGNLDSMTARDILDVFEELNNEGRTIVLVTHDQQVAARATRQIRMLDGRVLAQA